MGFSRCAGPLQEGSLHRDIDKVKLNLGPQGLRQALRRAALQPGSLRPMGAALIESSHQKAGPCPPTAKAVTGALRQE